MNNYNKYRENNPSFTKCPDNDPSGAKLIGNTADIQCALKEMPTKENRIMINSDALAAGNMEDGNPPKIYVYIKKILE